MKSNSQRKAVVKSVPVKAVKTAEGKEGKEGKKERKVAEKIVLSSAQQKNLDSCTTISAQIRYLNSEGFSTGQISAFLGKRYQHVRNVLQTPMKRVIKAEQTKEKTEKTETKESKKVKSAA